MFFSRLNRLSGMRKFTLIWFCQLVSVFGTAATRFALIIWAYQRTGQATTLALLGFFSFILYILLSPVAGVLADRIDRRILMVAGDLGAALMTLMLLVLYQSGGLQIWHLYLAEALTGAFEAFQLPAYNAAITMIIPKEQYARAAGMRALSTSLSDVAAPAFAGILLRLLGLGGVMVVDILTFFIGIAPLLVLTIPRPVMPEHGGARGSVWSDIRFGFRYIVERAGLRGLLLVYIGINLAAALTYYAVMDPMVLARTGGDELALASVKSALGMGGVVGGLIMSAWGGPKRKIHGVLLMGGVSFLLGDFMMGVGRTTPAWVFAAFFSAFFVPFIVACERSIWQSKVEPGVQGRVFAIQNMFRQMMMPVGYLVAGPLADHVFGPALMPGGALVGVFGPLVGVGPGAGMGVMFLFTALLGATACFGGYLFPAVRNVEADLPDHEPVVAAGSRGRVSQ
jgi:DHA3 family macrolide efflux protein-like MFS transporter